MYSCVFFAADQIVRPQSSHRTTTVMDEKFEKCGGQFCVSSMTQKIPVLEEITKAE